MLRTTASQPDPHGAAPGRRAAFSLIELLVVVTIIAVVVSIMLPALVGVRGSVRSLVCSSDMKSIAMRFSLFASADPLIERGDSVRLGPKQFWINDFQESLYGLDEFWDLGESDSGEVAGEADIMVCPAAPAGLIKREGLPCSNAALSPVERVSLALNRRLYQAEIEFEDQVVLSPVGATRVLASVLEHPYVPLVMDVDGHEAAVRGIEPFYTAPPGVRERTPYASGRYWMPSDRHGGSTNVAFVGGHVLRSSDPASEAWDWNYQADTP